MLAQGCEFYWIRGNDSVKLKLQMQQKVIQSVDTCMHVYDLLAKCVLDSRGTN